MSSDSSAVATATAARANDDDNNDSGRGDDRMRSLLAASLPLSDVLSMAQEMQQGRGPRLIVLRFKSSTVSLDSDSNYSMAACVCNAMQEPAAVSNGSIQIFGNMGKMKYGESSLNPDARSMIIVGIRHALNVAARFTDGFGGDPKADNPIVVPNTSQPVISYFDGIPAEAQSFLTTKPPFFFLIGYWVWINPEGNLDKAPTAFPVTLKAGNYYLCSGRESSKVYRVKDPGRTFFTPEGLELLAWKLSASGGDDNIRAGLGDIDLDPRVSFPTTGKLCVPTSLQIHPSNWDNLSLAAIDRLIPYRVASDSRVSQKWSVQVLQVEDDNSGTIEDVGNV